MVGGVPLLGLRPVSDRRRPARTVAFCAGLTLQPADEGPYAIAAYPVTEDAIETGTPRQVRADDLSADPAEVEVMRLNDARTLLIVPLVAGDVTSA